MLCCLSQLWELDTIGIKPVSIDAVDEVVQLYFENEVKRTPEGFYQVPLLWRNDPKILPTNRNVAERRLLTTSKRLFSLSMYAAYDSLFTQWKNDNIIEEIESNDSNDGYYLPHRAVLRSSSTTTPIRPVFDGSCKIGRFKSINDCLFKGPNLLELLPSILLRFRERLTAFTADIRRAFLNIKIEPKDQDFLRFLWWRTDVNNELVMIIFRHLRLVFGLACSPYLLNAVIHYHLDHWSGDTWIVMILKLAFYADNLVGSLDGKQDFEAFKSGAMSIMNDAKMELRE